MKSSDLTCTKYHVKGGTLTDQHRVWLKDYAPPQSASASSKKATSHSLSPADHFKVSTILKDLNNEQLIRLGTALGLRYPHLQRMHSLPEDLVSAWLNMEDEVMDTSGIPTWSSLIKALEDTDQKGVASHIRKEQHSSHLK